MLLLPLNDKTIALCLELYPTNPAALVILCSLYNVYTNGTGYPVLHDHVSTQPFLQNATAAHLTISFDKEIL